MPQLNLSSRCALPGCSCPDACSLQRRTHACAVRLISWARWVWRYASSPSLRRMRGPCSRSSSLSSSDHTCMPASRLTRASSSLTPPRSPPWCHLPPLKVGPCCTSSQHPQAGSQTHVISEMHGQEAFNLQYSHPVSTWHDGRELCPDSCGPVAFAAPQGTCRWRRRGRPMGSSCATTSAACMHLRL